jgi:hypothetical protein
MREESHLDDMRSAIRGDFERLAERRGGQELLSVPEEESEAAAPVEPVAEKTVPDEPEEPRDADELPAEAPRTWLDRLLGR